MPDDINQTPTVSEVPEVPFAGGAVEVPAEPEAPVAPEVPVEVETPKPSPAVDPATVQPSTEPVIPDDQATV